MSRSQANATANRLYKRGLYVWMTKKGTIYHVHWTHVWNDEPTGWENVK